MTHATSKLLSLLVLALALAGCHSADAVQEGQGDFVSAEAQGGGIGQGGRGAVALGVPESAGVDLSGDGAAQRTVQEGDIYRVLSGGMILNLNRYRGLQVIDVSDPEQPTIVGQARLSGSPVELYVHGDRALVLMNDYQSYYGSRDDVRVESHSGGQVISVDLSDPKHPIISDRAPVTGNIITSRMVSGGDAAALYVAAQDWGQYGALSTGFGGAISVGGIAVGDSRTYVKSFDVSSGGLAEKSEIELGGDVTDIQATARALLVARTDYSAGEGSGRVAVVDISDPAGSMALGDEVRTRGIVRSQFNMDLHGDQLRIVSGRDWGGDNAVQTFDASDLTDIQPIATCAFGGEQDLFATIFLPERAFFVTYLRQDPFHAFSLPADGSCEERSEFIVSGWNDFFRPVFDDSRLIGVGVNDEDARRGAISLYDITDLDNAEPLLARAEVNVEGDSWSEASWDHRAFSVLDDAVQVQAGDGTAETGLVLLPFEGWSEQDGQQFGVQVFTFSETTLTRRGLLDHGSSVRRAFLVEANQPASLSEASLALHDVSDPDSPRALGTLELAPDYGQLFRFGDHLVRVKYPAVASYGPAGLQGELTVEVVDAAEDPDAAPTRASIRLPADAALAQVGDLLLALRPDGDYSGDYERDSLQTTLVTVHDLSDPENPELRGEVRASLPLQADNGWGYAEPGLDCAGGCDFGGFPGQRELGAHAVGDSLVLLERIHEERLLGSRRVCFEYALEEWDCSPEETCVYNSGSRECEGSGADQVCSGGFMRCEDSPEGSSCEPISGSELHTERDCYTEEDRRYWQSFTFHIIDLADPDAPSVADPVRMAGSEEGQGVLQVGDRIYYTFQRPVDVDSDPRPHVRHYFRSLDFTDAATPSVGEAVNVPGRLLAVDGETLFTLDAHWGEELTVDSTVHRLRLRDGRALLQQSQGFAGEQVQQVVVDPAGQLLVTHRELVDYWEGQGPDTMLTLLSRQDLSESASLAIDTWAQLKLADRGRALFEVPAGLLLVDVSDAEAPEARAYYPLQGWPQAMLLEAERVLIAAGRYGLYALDADSHNLLEK